MKIVAAALLLVSLSAFGADKFLDYRFNENVVIRISNLACPAKTGLDAKKWPWVAMARRIDNQILIGCYNHSGDDIVIQWVGGDQSKFPANYFLAEKMEPNT